MGSDTYKVYIRANILVILGYAIVAVETFIAKALGLAAISYLNTLVIFLIVISGSISTILILNYKKAYDGHFEKRMFFSLLYLYLTLFSFWVYLLKDFRLFGLFCSILAITIVLLYAGLAQSLIMSLCTITAYILTSAYSIFIAGQDGNFIKDVFFALCFIPTSVLFSIVASQIKKKNGELEKTKQNLEDTNMELTLLNRKLEESHRTTRIEMELASDIQKAFFPEVPKNIAAWDIALYFKPKNGLSGDFYDFYYDGGRFTGLGLFDVSGHGLPSALITILAKPVFYQYFNIFRNEQLGRVVEVVNNSLRHDLGELNMYITGAILRFRENDVEYVNVGHPDIIYKSRESGKTGFVIEEEMYYKSSPIGLLDTVSSCKSRKLSPAKGDIILLYTDCITESNNIDKNRYGSARLLKSLEEAPDGTANEILDFLLGRFDIFMNTKETDDDFTAIVVKKI